jgi:hypothetical protein
MGVFALFVAPIVTVAAKDVAGSVAAAPEIALARAAVGPDGLRGEREEEEDAEELHDF